MTDKAYPVTHSDAEWRRLLTPELYEVMRSHGTEAPGSCALLLEKRRGKFSCAGCGPSGDQFLTWGWRIPFFISIVMVGIGLWIRLGILETPVFRKVVAEDRIERVPVLEVLKRQPKQIALSALLRMPEQAPGYIYGAFVFTYGTTILGASREFLLVATLVSAVLGFLWIPGICRTASVEKTCI